MNLFIHYPFLIITFDSLWRLLHKLTIQLIWNCYAFIVHRPKDGSFQKVKKFIETFFQVVFWKLRSSFIKWLWQTGERWRSFLRPQVSPFDKSQTNTKQLTNGLWFLIILSFDYRWRKIFSKEFLSGVLFKLSYKNFSI